LLTDKIKSREELKEIVKDIRKKDKISKIVTTNGAFDILHKGHIKTLEKAKTFGNVLIVGLNSDSSIKKYKSKNRPIINQEDRAFVIAALSCVDYVTIFYEQDPIEFLKSIKPDFHIKSKSGFKGIETNVVEENKGKIILIDDIPDLSTTNIIEKILKIYR